MQIITLTTDFGTDDWFAGTMKGVILSVNPKASIVDITHGIAPGDIRSGAFALAAAYRFFPRGTVHVAVVDPGVGSERKAIAVRTKDYVFVGPENGLLSCALAREVIRSIHRLENKKFFLPFVSQTFQGRDVFAPVAAHLSKGVAIGKLGPRAASCKMLTLPTPIRRGHELVGEVIYLDRFGNGITNIRREDLEAWEADGLKKNRALARNPPPTPPRRGAYFAAPVTDSPPGKGEGVGSWESIRIKLAGRKGAFPLVPFYQAVSEGQPLGILGSAEFLEIAINGGSAAERLALRVGSAVTLLRDSPRV